MPNRWNQRIFEIEALVSGLLSNQGVDVPQRRDYTTEEEYMKADNAYWHRHRDMVEKYIEMEEELGRLKQT